MHNLFTPAGSLMRPIRMRQPLPKQDHYKWMLLPAELT